MLCCSQEVGWTAVAVVREGGGAGRFNEVNALHRLAHAATNPLISIGQSSALVACISCQRLTAQSCPNPLPTTCAPEL